MRIIHSSQVPVQVLQNWIGLLYESQTFCKKQIITRLANFTLGIPVGISSAEVYTLRALHIILLPVQLVYRYIYKSDKYDDFGMKAFLRNTGKVLLCVFSTFFTPTVGLFFPKLVLDWHRFVGLADSQQRHWIPAKVEVIKVEEPSTSPIGNLPQEAPKSPPVMTPPLPQSVFAPQKNDPEPISNRSVTAELLQKELEKLKKKKTVKPEIKEQKKITVKGEWEILITSLLKSKPLQHILARSKDSASTRSNWDDPVEEISKGTDSGLYSTVGAFGTPPKQVFLSKTPNFNRKIGNQILQKLEELHKNGVVDQVANYAQIAAVVQRA